MRRASGRKPSSPSRSSSEEPWKVGNLTHFGSAAYSGYNACDGQWRPWKTCLTKNRTCKVAPGSAITTVSWCWLVLIVQAASMQEIDDWHLPESLEKSVDMLVLLNGFLSIVDKLLIANFETHPTFSATEEALVSWLSWLAMVPFDFALLPLWLTLKEVGERICLRVRNWSSNCSL